MKALLRWIVVTVCTVVLTTLGLNAFDNRDTPQNSMLGSAFSAFAGAASKCPTGMVFVGTSGGGFCIDAYENSAGSSCTSADPSSKSQTSDNLGISACKSESVAKKSPWRNISRDQAELACARAGKRLPLSAPHWGRFTQRRTPRCKRELLKSICLSAKCRCCDMTRKILGQTASFSRSVTS